MAPKNKPPVPQDVERNAENLQLALADLEQFAIVPTEHFRGWGSHEVLMGCAHVAGATGVWGRAAAI